MKHNRISLFLILILMLAAGCEMKSNDFSRLNLEEGQIDVSSWKVEHDEIIPLNGLWEFYWKEHDVHNTTKKVYIKVPSTWNKEKGLPGKGYATYRLVIRGLKENVRYGMMLPSMSTAYELIVNGQALASSGQVGKSENTTKPLYTPQEVFFTSEGHEAEILIHIANFHYRDGGIWETISFGTEETIREKGYKKLAFKSTIFGCLLLSGLYHLILYMQRRKNISALMFSIVCFIVCIRIITTDEILLIDFVPSIPWSLIVKLEYLSFYTSLPLFCWVLYSLFPDYFSKRYVSIFTLVSGLMSLVVIFTPTAIFTHTSLYYQVMALGTILYVSITLIRTLLNKQEGSLILNLCTVFLSLTVINDILSVNGIIQSIQISYLGLAVFIFSQAYIIANRSSKAFNEMERMTEELALLNQTLEEKVKERTRSLVSSRDDLQVANEQLKKLSYVDQLTKISNRRCFEERYKELWRTACTEAADCCHVFRY
ncbi:7TM diverse intracellular signaling domain-containing protein [Rossellomorea sp. AcN35-11]|nr:7TM diverse intracellular signaling domain-containing protein [Rossellomorea sp. AcN35-11]